MKRTLHLSEARVLLANQLAHQHLDSKIQHWKLIFDNAKTRCASCQFTYTLLNPTITIAISKVFAVFATDGEFKNTVLHEIAHAIAGIDAGHGPVWKRIALEIGCDAKRLHRANGEHQSFLDQGMKRVKCPCGKIDFLRHRVKRKFVTKNVCKECRGTLEVFGNDVSKIKMNKSKSK
jgi:predicted SprT family Zn-dependent metalloprotease